MLLLEPSIHVTRLNTYNEARFEYHCDTYGSPVKLLKLGPPLIPAGSEFCHVTVDVALCSSIVKGDIHENFQKYPIVGFAFIGFDFGQLGPASAMTLPTIKAPQISDVHETQNRRGWQDRRGWHNGHRSYRTYRTSGETPRVGVRARCNSPHN